MTSRTEVFGRHWQAVLDGDRQALHRMVEPYLSELITAARRDLDYCEQVGELHPGDLEPEELVGETLLRAWHGRRQRPQAMSLRAWLLAMQQRVLRKLIEVEHLERDPWAVSLEDPLPPEPLFDEDASFWEWYQPDDVTRWEDILPAEPVPADVALEADAATVQRLQPEERQVLLLHDEHALSLAEVALAIGRPLSETRALLEQARQAVREKSA